MSSRMVILCVICLVPRQWWGDGRACRFLAMPSVIRCALEICYSADLMNLLSDRGERSFRGDGTLYMIYDAVRSMGMSGSELLL